MNIASLNREGHKVWELREAAKAAMNADDVAAQDAAYDAWSVAADDLADAAREQASELHIGIEELRARLDVHARDAFTEPAV